VDAKTETLMENAMTETAMNIDPVHIAWRCGTEDQTRRVVSDLEGALAEAMARRDKILFDLAKAAAAIDGGDKRARFVHGALNKEEVAVGRLVRSIEKQLGEARKRLATIEAHAATAAARLATADEAALVRDKLFEVICPDGHRKVRHRHHSLEALRRELQPGYRAVGQVFGANDDGTGGFVSMPGAPSMLRALLESEGDVLMEWLAERGLPVPTRL
jgi:hypothetical protein